MKNILWTMYFDERRNKWRVEPEDEDEMGGMLRVFWFNDSITAAAFQDYANASEIEPRK